MAHLGVTGVAAKSIQAVADGDDLSIALDGTTTHVEIINASSKDIFYSFDGLADSWVRISGRRGNFDEPHSQLTSTLGAAGPLRIRGTYFPYGAGRRGLRETAGPLEGRRQSVVVNQLTI